MWWRRPFAGKYPRAGTAKHRDLAADILACL
jgi:hypothetical protein